MRWCRLIQRILMVCCMCQELKGREVVRVMLQNKYPLSEICKISGVTEEELLVIKESM